MNFIQVCFVHVYRSIKQNKIKILRKKSDMKVFIKIQTLETAFPVIPQFNSIHFKERKFVL